MQFVFSTSPILFFSRWICLSVTEMTAFVRELTIVLHDFNSETSKDIKIAVSLCPPFGPPNVILIFNFSRSIFFPDGFVGLLRK